MHTWWATYCNAWWVTKSLVEGQVGVLKATAVELPLHVAARLVAGHTPALFCQSVLLLCIDSQTGTGQSKLQQEQEEEYDHVLNNC